MPVGKKVKGYGLLNEFGEFEFTPAKVGANLGKLKTVKEDEDFSFKESINYLLVNIRIPKSKTRMSRVQAYLNIMNKVLNVISTYEF